MADNQDALDALDTEVELISASLLFEETLSSRSSSLPREISISNSESLRTLKIVVGAGYPSPNAVTVEMKGNDIGRDEAFEWDTKIKHHMCNWAADGDYPLYEMLTTHLLPLLAPTKPASTPTSQTASAQKPGPSVIHHALLTSHHLLSNTKRKNFIALASQLSLTGFSKVGHPGIYYAMGEKDDLDEWVREVKSWNWLALRIRVGVEPLPSRAEEMGTRGKEDGARGGKGRGEWVELEKIGEALEWMRKRGREGLLLDIGIGS